MNKETLRQPLIYCVIFGIILGLLCAIPFVNALAITAVFILTGIFALIQYILSNPTEKPDMLQSVCLSAGGGFISGFFGCIIFIPIAIIFNIFGLSTLLEGVNFIILILLSFFFALICAMTNAFIGSGFMYIYNIFKK